MFDPKVPFTHTPRCAGKVTATLCPKNGSHLILIKTLANVDRFSKFFHHLIREKILYVQTQRLLRYVTTLPCESKKSKMLLILTIRYDSVYLTCTELVLKVMDAGYCLYVHIFMKNIKSLKPFNFYNSNQLTPDLRFQQSRRDN